MKIILVMIIATAIFLFISFKKKSREAGASMEPERTLAHKQEKHDCSSISEEDIIQSDEFQACSNKLQKVYEWMSLVEMHGCNLSVILQCPYEKPYLIVLEIKGYDLWTENFKKYENGTKWEEREVALNEFRKNLFGYHAEEAKTLVNMEFIADHLITVDEPERFQSDYTLRYDFIIACLPEWGNPRNIRELYKKSIKA